MTLAILIAVAVAGYVYWRLHRTNTDIRAQDDYTADDTWSGPVQVIHYIQPRKGQPI